MKYPLDELIDKRAIVRIKIERIDNKKEREMLFKEHDELSYAIDEFVVDKICTKTDAIRWHRKLYIINGKIWDLEADIRKGKDGELGLEEVGKRAMMIRKINGERIKVKSEIVEKTGIGYKDIKVNHASSGD